MKTMKQNNKQVRRMFESLGNRVSNIARVSRWPKPHFVPLNVFLFCKYIITCTDLYRFVHSMTIGQQSSPSSPTGNYTNCVNACNINCFFCENSSLMCHATWLQHLGPRPGFQWPSQVPFGTRHGTTRTDRTRLWRCVKMWLSFARLSTWVLPRCLNMPKLFFFFVSLWNAIPTR